MFLYLPLWHRLTTIGGSALLVLLAIHTLVAGEAVTFSAPLHFVCTLLFVFTSLCDAHKQNRMNRSEARVCHFLTVLDAERRAATDPNERSYFRGGRDAVATFMTMDGQIKASKLAELNAQAGEEEES